ncbi:unnamed protein product [Cyprideis torosa]|uniref:Uncharacterized protein n=1 Tax=Cyprideis torosa TaxID=163714 RepID=A0A7R8WD98_9CRUS|nr:unnamed protein product [Cyprideis torosa]CAG0892922.1 unnamed protein product [Cyprideis torosa]
MFAPRSASVTQPTPPPCVEKKPIRRERKILTEINLSSTARLLEISVQFVCRRIQEFDHPLQSSAESYRSWPGPCVSLSSGPQPPGQQPLSTVLLLLLQAKKDDSSRY